MRLYLHYSTEESDRRGRNAKAGMYPGRIVVNSEAVLLTFRGFPHDSQSVLTAVYQLALVSIKLRPNIGAWRGKAGLELSIAPFTYADCWKWGFLYDPQFALPHDCSLAHLVGRA